MSIPYTREVAEIVALFSPTAAQARRIDAELTPIEKEGAKND